MVTALRNAVDSDSAAHAYMFSGPRGTGKTSTARIFAKALNCTSLESGEPCCECASCVAMEAGTSFDLFELDAASNNGVEAIRDLVERTMVVSPGRTKVYILDEVHMLSRGASNALLKTLEEPPEHVRFVLATTDPQKVLPTIRSRTQHFEFRLLTVDELTEHARWVCGDAGLEVAETSIAHAVKQGRGSVRDMLSALDQVIATGGVFERPAPLDELFSALADGSGGAALLAVVDAVAQGHDPRTLAEAFVAEIREAFLLSIGAEALRLVDSDRERLGAWAEKLGPAKLSRAMERIGLALVDMRSAADPRVPLEVALIQLTAVSSAAPTTGSDVPGSGGSDDRESGRSAELTDLRARVERLEAALAEGRVPAMPRVEATEAPRGDATGREPATRRGGSASEKTSAGTGGSGGAGGSSKAAEARAALKQTERAKPPPPPPRSRSGAPTERRAPAPQPPRPAAGPTSEPWAHHRSEESQGEPAASAAPSPRPDTSPGSLPDRDSLVMAFGDSVVPKLKGIAKAIYSQGRFVSVAGDHAVFAVENAPTRDRAERYRAEVESLLSQEFAVAVPLRLVIEGDESPASDDEAEIMAQVSELEDADVQISTVDRLTAAFPGAELIESEETT